MKTDTFTIRKMADLHVHFRRGEMLKLVTPMTAAQCGMATVMPNTTPGIFTAEDVVAYRDEIMAALPPDSKFNPIMTIKLRDDTTPDQILHAHTAGAKAAKVYPAGVTTNSDDGVKSLRSLDEVFKRMESLGMILCIHGEEPGVFSLDRETIYMSRIISTARRFPELKVVAEHITCAQTIYSILEEGLPNLGATITAHHLMITLDDVIGDKLKPHNFCKPIAKRERDRAELLQAALGLHGNKFFLGSDTAPHAQHTKECAECCAGVFTGPILGEVLLEVFMKERPGNWKEYFEEFACLNGPKFYGIDPSEETVTFEQKEWTVPQTYGNVVPFLASKKLQWKQVK